MPQHIPEKATRRDEARTGHSRESAVRARLSGVEEPPAMLCVPAAHLCLQGWCSRCDASKAFHGVAGMSGMLFPLHWGQNEEFHEGECGCRKVRMIAL